jgi:catechol 2,3-dioxygenase-like lactoylglutathione lyase family enzyme
MMDQKLHILTLGVNDLRKSVEFYENGLGWKPSAASNEQIKFYAMGGVVLALYPRNLLAEDVGTSAEGTGFPAMTVAYNAKSEIEVDEVFALIRRLGATIVKQPQKVFWGGYSGYFADPDGHLWEVAYNPFFGFDEKGNLALP